VSFDTRKYTQSPFLHGADLPEGEKVVVTIKSAEEVTFPSGDTSPVLEFLELDQKLTLNKGRTVRLVELFGDEPDEWIGQRIALYAVDVTYQGKMTLGVAVGKAPARATKSKVTVEDDVEFEKPAKRKAAGAPVVVVEDDIPF